MNNYIPFLKLKGSEISALIALQESERALITPFFDFPRRDEKKTRNPLVEQKTKEENFTSALSSTSKRLQKKLSDLNEFYLDNYDLEDSFRPNGRGSYEQIIESFAPLGMIPVIGLDRSEDHIDSIYKANEKKAFSHNRIAIRLTKDDFSSPFKLIEDEISELHDNILCFFTKVDLIFDCRVIGQQDVLDIENKILDFIADIEKDYSFNAIIITGSIIPASIADIVKPNSVETFSRKEISLYENVKGRYKSTAPIFCGDYTCVSPEYSDTDFFAEDLQNIMAAKVIYPFHKNGKEIQYITRGGRLKKDRTQYITLCNEIISHQMSFFRGHAFSFGDCFLYNTAHGIKKETVTPASITKPLINLHIKYMISR
ncbi:beta family protein [Aeromonas sp. FDAARGOS 1416]|uniref:beta family protein n=1 Tax=Aeromonas TaxID=642 RepID=UPI001C250AE9|nr:beta family protein [Aeromonas sp. FDAARGOS 1416]QXB01025.1 beta family protein [Aeromonas sp. FDAARGOS 1416]